ncbi:hypothetical protein NLJ89_g8920 [Agrocybe chaxingu]|uniref:F-box domain-containing protein n=1 Tax=Agrocybe chaxingu TaxID=84603 RepID=A0A9W8MRQ2_9AGAR|nr:hypothetical protein NLJ89_g8920 [Agrocybe chaxingu]
MPTEKHIPVSSSSHNTTSRTVAQVSPKAPKPSRNRPSASRRNPSASSSVLSNLNLLRLIFLHFCDPCGECLMLSDAKDLEPGDKKHMLWAALVCKSFSEPALDILWRQMDSLFPLLKIFPNFMLSGGVYTFQGAISDKALDRFHGYARRLRVLNFSTDSAELNLARGRVASYAYTYLSRAIAPSEMLPGLHSIYIKSNITHLADTLLLIQPSKLHTLTSISRRLSDSDKDRIDLSGSLTPHVVDHLSKFSKLKDVKLELGKTLNAWLLMEILSKTPSLTDISITADRSTDIPPYHKSNKLVFSSLQSLAVIGSICQVVNLIVSLQPEKLEMLYLRWAHLSPALNAPQGNQTPSTAVHGLVNMTHSLRQLSLFANEEVENEGVSLQPSFLSNLNKETMTRLDIHGFLLALDDLRIQRLCQPSSPWTSLQVLHLPKPARNKFPTLRSLRFIARHCPRLQSLEMWVHLSSANVQSLKEEVGSLPNSRHGLESLLLHRVNAHEKLEPELKLGTFVACYIIRLFPFVSVLKRQGTSDEDWWEGIGELIDMCQSMNQRYFKMFMEDLHAECPHSRGG